MFPVLLGSGLGVWDAFLNTGQRPLAPGRFSYVIENAHTCASGQTSRFTRRETLPFIKHSRVRWSVNPEKLLWNGVIRSSNSPGFARFLFPCCLPTVGSLGSGVGHEKGKGKKPTQTEAELFWKGKLSEVSWDRFCRRDLAYDEI